MDLNWLCFNSQWKHWLYIMKCEEALTWRVYTANVLTFYININLMPFFRYLEEAQYFSKKLKVQWEYFEICSSLFRTKLRTTNKAGSFWIFFKVFCHFPLASGCAKMKGRITFFCACKENSGANLGRTVKFTQCEVKTFSISPSFLCIFFPFWVYHIKTR